MPGQQQQQGGGYGSVVQGVPASVQQGRQDDAFYAGLEKQEEQQAEARSIDDMMAKIKQQGVARVPSHPPPRIKMPEEFGGARVSKTTGRKAVKDMMARIRALESLTEQSKVPDS